MVAWHGDAPELKIDFNMKLHMPEHPYPTIGRFLDVSVDAPSFVHQWCSTARALSSELKATRTCNSDLPMPATRAQAVVVTAHLSTFLREASQAG